ncbi:RNA12 protein-domain-containing protein [Daldinia decipiens]|uniref:RNA12 protein-domain-containing protein n=1 Tax=Daldinia decipiens TaxID=326647 RepID=UPI0020C33AF3|nr:RNA12 protein-domain-containing protein [Daldinia decipiens]KAI1655751.1 RNA12 protein-domain-containing protein [Daldinia decipiens]
MIPRYPCLGPRSLPGLRALRTPGSFARPILTQRHQPRWTSVPRAWESTTTGEGRSGHIDAAPNESILWIDNLFPLKLSGLLRTPWKSPDLDVAELMKQFRNSTLGALDPMNMVKRAIPKTVPVNITEILPRLKDGGAFVKFTYPADVPAKEIEAAISKYLQEQPVRPFFSPFRGVQAGLVSGVPWLEDLHRFPKDRLRVEFVPKNPGEEAVELSQETLYSLFRRYGKIAEIVSQPWDSKVFPKYAYVDFASVRDAIMARNCLHGFVVPEDLGGGKSGTRLRMSYEQRVQPHRFWEWISNHPRIVIPVLVALLTGLTVIIFDPIRSFFVKAHVTRRFRISNSKLYRWLRRRTVYILNLKREKADQAGLSAVWTHRRDLIHQIQKWLLETAETFIVVQGPRGSGKKELVLDQALKDRSNVLVIDCKPIVEARGESATIKEMAASVGYRPIFSYANSLSSMVDLAVQSTTGVKAGFSETLESQLQKILQTAAAALTDIGISDRHKTDSDASLPVDAYLEAHPEKRPVVVIDNFLHKGDTNAIVYDKIAEWAAALVQSNIAHVIFLTNDSSYSKYLSKALPDRVFRQTALGDLSPDVAKRFILSHITNGEVQLEAKGDLSDSGEKQPAWARVLPDLGELDECIGTLGGRLTDLEFLARRLKAGQSPKQAVEEITEQSASEILKFFLLPGKTTNDGEHKWSVEQAWYLVKALAGSDSLRYNEVLLHNTFASSTSVPDGEAALEGLSNAELITLKLRNGRPALVAPGKPVYAAAFRLLACDPVLAAKMDLAVLTELAKAEAKNIDKAETELALLGGLPRQPAQTAGRTTYLLGKIDAAQRKVEAYEREMGALKKVLCTED